MRACPSFLFTVLFPQHLMFLIIIIMCFEKKRDHRKSFNEKLFLDLFYFLI
jgi:hypothetical protein